jgi:hypothetical protein
MRVKKSLNHFSTIIVVIALIGILTVPVVTAGKIITYGPAQGIKTMPVANFTPPAVVTPKTVPFAYSPSKWQNPIRPNPASGNGGNSGSISIPGPMVTRADPSCISGEEAIRIALKSVSNISLTTDPVATLNTRWVTDDFRGFEYMLKKQVWVVTLSGVSTDPNAIGVKQWFNSRTGEIIDVPIHANRWVTIDAINGRVISVDSCF